MLSSLSHDCHFPRVLAVREQIYYGPSDTTHGNVGDSWCSMARIAWFDAHARKRLGDLDAFEKTILAPIQRDLIAYTWLRERYDCSGQQQLNRTGEFIG